MDPLTRLLAGDTTIPAGRVEAAASLVMVDRAAESGGTGPEEPWLRN
jgi:6-phosphogluconolactonase